MAVRVMNGPGDPITILSDIEKGGTIWYASPKAMDWLGIDVKIGPGMPFESFLRGLQPSIDKVAAPTGILEVDAETAARKLNHLTSYAVLEHSSVITGEAPCSIGVALLPIFIGSRGLVTCKFIMTLLDHPVKGRCCLTLLCDVSEEFTPELVLGMASTGEYFTFMRNQKLIARSDDFRQHLDGVGRSVVETVQCDSVEAVDVSEASTT